MEQQLKENILERKSEAAPRHMHIKIKAQCAYSDLKHIVVSLIFNFLPLFTQSVRLCVIQADGGLI